MASTEGSSPRSTNTVLSQQQQKTLNERKTNLRLANARYLAAHPEFNDLLKAFTTHCLEKCPENVLEEAVDFFTDENLREKVAGGKYTGPSSERQEATGS